MGQHPIDSASPARANKPFKRHTILVLGDIVSLPWLSERYLVDPTGFPRRKEQVCIPGLSIQCLIPSYEVVDVLIPMLWLRTGRFIEVK